MQTTSTTDERKTLDASEVSDLDGLAKEAALALVTALTALAEIEIGDVVPLAAVGRCRRAVAQARESLRALRRNLRQAGDVGAEAVVRQ